MENDGREASYQPPSRSDGTVWYVDADGPKTVELHISMFTGRETVLVNGKVVRDELSMNGAEFKLPLTGAVAILRTGVSGLSVIAELRVDGQLVAPAPGSALGARAGSTPWWGWVAALLAFAPVVALTKGALVGWLIGLGGSVCVVTASRSPGPPAWRVVASLVIVLGAWGLVAACMYAMQGS